MRQVCSDIRERTAAKIDQILTEVLGYEPTNEIVWEDAEHTGMLACCDDVPLILFFPVVAEQKGDKVSVTQDYHIYLENFARVSWTK